MQDLQLVGIHEDGAHLVLSDGGDAEFSLPIDQRLRDELRRGRPRTMAETGLAEADSADEQLRPRDIQNLLRAGVGRAEVAQRSGWDLAKVERYEAPIRAERDHIALLAQGAPLHGPRGGKDSVGTFGDRVTMRLQHRGVDNEDVHWDAWRTEAAGWTVVCNFPAGGRERQAQWSFDQATRSLQALEDEARWLGEDEQSPGPIPAAQAARSGAGSARPSSVYDLDAEGGLDAVPSRTVRTSVGGSAHASDVPAPPVVEATSTDEGAEQPVDLMSAMRQRSRGRRRAAGRQSGSANKPVAPVSLTQNEIDTADAPPHGSHPDPEELSADQRNVPAETSSPEPEDAAPEAKSAKPSVDELGHDPVTGTVDLFAEVDRETGLDDETAESELIAEDTPEPSVEPESEPIAAPVEETVAKTDAEPDQVVVPERSTGSRKGRPSVPSWDDIMFGTKGRD